MVFCKGIIPWNKGLTKSDDARIKVIGNIVSQKLKGRHNSSRTEFKKSTKSSWRGHNWEACRKCGKDHGSNPMKGKKRSDLTLRNLTHNPMRNSEVKVMMMKIWHSSEFRKKISKLHKGKVVSKETGRKISTAKKGKPSPKSRREGYFGNHNWISRREPNKSERKVDSWIKEANLDFEYTGNKVDPRLGISPDWKHAYKPYYLEFDGAFWHSDRGRNTKRNRIYAAKGCKLLILTDEDLKNKDRAIGKIQEFIQT